MAKLIKIELVLTKLLPVASLGGAGAGDTLQGV